MPGVLIKSEPFVAPIDELELRRQARANFDDDQTQSAKEAHAKKISLGNVYHRGNLTRTTVSNKFERPYSSHPHRRVYRQRQKHYYQTHPCSIVGATWRAIFSVIPNR